jgi:3-dehydroquinate synthase
MTTVQVDLGERSYPIHIDRGAISILPDVLRSLDVSGPVAICTDTNVANLHADAMMAVVREAGAQPVLCKAPAGEQAKRLAHVESFIGRFLEAGLDRTSVVIAFGGGVVGDMAAFAAAVFMRGIRFIQVPTTVVAQVDSSVGGKTGVNHQLAKNIIGAFHQPSAVVIDLNYLETLPPRELRAGLAEVIKHGIIADADLFAYMENNADKILAGDLEAMRYPVSRSCEIKADVVSQDEREHGIRANLNYGHTFGHGIEAASNYTKFLHGEAIALGMRAAAALARDLSLIDADTETRHNACIAKYELPATWPDLPADNVIAAMRMDKKVRKGTMKFVVADRIGHVIHRTDITDAQALRALETLRSA